MSYHQVSTTKNSRKKSTKRQDIIVHKDIFRNSPLYIKYHLKIAEAINNLPATNPSYQQGLDDTIEIIKNYYFCETEHDLLIIINVGIEEAQKLHLERRAIVMYADPVSYYQGMIAAFETTKEIIEKGVIEDVLSQS